MPLGGQHAVIDNTQARVITNSFFLYFDIVGYHCGVLLKAKRKFQLLYELSARIQPQGCVNCGIREIDQLRVDIGHVGLLCSVCSKYLVSVVECSERGCYSEEKSAFIEFSPL